MLLLMGSFFLLCRRLRWFWTKQLTELIHQVSRESVSKNQVALFPVQSNGQRSTLGVLRHFFAGLCPFVTLSLSVFFCSAPAWRNPSVGWWGWPSWGVSEGTLGAPFAHNCDLLAKWNTCRARESSESNLFWQPTKGKVQIALQEYGGREWRKGNSKISF